MTADVSTGTLSVEPLTQRRPAFWSKARRIARQQVLGVVGFVIVVALVVTAIAAPLIAPYDPTDIQFDALQPPSAAHLFGTDEKGRDVFSRVVYGSRISLEIGLIATTIGSVGGALVGIASGYFRGKVDLILQRITDAVQSFPFLILALIMVAVFGSSTVKLMIMIGLTIVPGVGRVMRGAVLSESQGVYIEAAHATGSSAPRIMFRHILPNVAAPLVVVATSLLGAAILIEAGLSFLGFGTPPPTPSWGADLSGNARQFFVRAPWMAIFPGLALSVVVLGVNLMGDSLRDILDPRLRGR
jgi:peptide/nickel transport system permease protein